MVIHITVKSAQPFDRLWRQGDGLYAHLREIDDSAVNGYLIRYLAERLHVARSLIEITKGQAASRKTIWVKIPYADLVQRIKKLDELPQASLFE